MKYTGFIFKNFKGIRELKVPINEGVTTLIGLNESGKTTILEAIFCFSYGAEDLEKINPGMASVRRPEEWIPVSERANFNGNISITATVLMDEADKFALKKFMQEKFDLTLSMIPTTLVITEQYEYKNSRRTRTRRIWGINANGTKGKQRNTRRYDHTTLEWNQLIVFLEDRLPRIWYFPDFLFELPDRFKISEPMVIQQSRVEDPFMGQFNPRSQATQAIAKATDESLDRDRFYRSIFENIMKSLGNGATLDTLIERLRSNDRADRRNLDALRLEMSRLVTDTVFGAWSRIFVHDLATQEVHIEAAFDSDGAAFLELKIKGADGYYDLSERSLGFRWFFMFILMTSFLDQTIGRPKPLILLDEPASNLHSSAQAELLKSFEKLAEHCNLVYTTHSHHLINIRWLDTAFVVKNTGLEASNPSSYYSSRVGANTSIEATRYREFVSNNPSQTSYIQPVLDLLQYHPSVLEPVPNVVLVEGKSDFYAFRYMDEILEIESGLHFVPGGGAGSLDPLIRLHVGWGKGFLILLDGDAEGKKQRERYDSEFGPLVSGRCFLIPELCGDSNVLEIEHLFGKADREAIASRAGADGSKSSAVSKKNFNRALTELYSGRIKAHVEEATVTRFERLFAELSERLSQI